jgi:hypothetical protein
MWVVSGTSAELEPIREHRKLIRPSHLRTLTVDVMRDYSKRFGGPSVRFKPL